MKHAKNIAVTLTFVLLLALGLAACIWSGAHPKSYSRTEKRPLAQFPRDVTWHSLVDKSSIDQFEDFTVDQFPARQFFRALKARFVTEVLGQKQNNGYATEEGSIAQIKTAFDDESIDYSLSRLADVCERYSLDTKRLSLAIIPDKNYFFAKNYGYPAPDYEALVKRARQKLPDATYIDLFPHLSLSDYYKTDWHWDQSKLDGVLATLGEAMGFGDRLSGEYKENVLEGFLGGYYDQSALYPSAEQMIYLTNEILDACTVYDYENGKTYGLYNHELYKSKTPYDFFLSGTRALLRIDNPNATTKDKLIVFRDSYGASLVPLMAEGYASIYVVDLRYVHPDIITRMLGSVQGMDVLYMLSTTVLNSKNFK